MLLGLEILDPNVSLGPALSGEKLGLASHQCFAVLETLDTLGQMKYS